MQTKKLHLSLLFDLKIQITLLFIAFLSFSFSSKAQSGDYDSYCGVTQEIVNYNDFVYEIWQNASWADGCLVIKNNTDFYVSWSNISNTLVRKSKRPGATNQVMDYYIDHQISGNSFYSAYGWWRDTDQPNEYHQIVEWYVLEGYGVHKPIDGLTYIKDYTTSEGTYELWIGDDRYDPTVYGAGNMKFTQIKSIRKTERSSGTITMANHFNEWAAAGFAVKNLYEISMKVEGFSEGSHDPTSGGSYVRADFSTGGTYNGGSGSSSGNTGSGTINGTYRLKARSGGRYATSDDSNYAAVKETQSEDWNSQHWTLEHVSGDIYRLKEEYGGRYLSGNNNSGAVEVADSNSGNAQKWKLEQVGSRYRLRCQWGGKYLTSPNSNWGSLTVQSGSAGWNKQFTLEALPKSAVSIDPINKEEGLSVYPNPASNVLNISLSGSDNLSQNASVIIYDLQGSMLSKQPLLQNFTTLDISNLSVGNYFMQVTTDNNIYTQILSKN